MSESTDEVQTPGRVDEVVRTRLEIPYAVGSKVRRGDVLVYVYEDAQRERVAEDIVRSEIVGRVRVLVEGG